MIIMQVPPLAAKGVIGVPDKQSVLEFSEPSSATDRQLYEVIDTEIPEPQRLILRYHPLGSPRYAIAYSDLVADQAEA